MKIIVDAYGGDHAPLEVLKGARQAIDELSVEILLVGDEGGIQAAAKKHQISLQGMEILHTAEVITMCDDPLSLLKEKSNTSMAVGFRALTEKKGDAFVSAGNSGALLVGGTFIVKRIKGIKRAALAPVIPCFGGVGHFILMDAGANTECRPEMICQFATMGSIYMEKILGVNEPKVGLVNIGGEETKGRDLEIESHQLLKTSSLNFYGNLEPREIPQGECQVVVTDGFTGNVVLKLMEGMGKSFSTALKSIFMESVSTKISALLVKSGLDGFKKKMDYKEQGGALLMGVKQPVIKAHGSSDGRAFKNAIGQAKKFVETNVISEIEESLLKTKE